MTACIVNMYKEVNGRDCPKFTAADWTQLNKFLRECSWSINDITQCIGNVFKSEAHRLSPPRNWLPRLSAFAEGPRNEFFQPVKQNGKPAEKEVHEWVPGERINGKVVPIQRTGGTA